MTFMLTTTSALTNNAFNQFDLYGSLFEEYLDLESLDSSGSNTADGEMKTQSGEAGIQDPDDIGMFDGQKEDTHTCTPSSQSMQYTFAHAGKCARCHSKPDLAGVKEVLWTDSPPFGMPPVFSCRNPCKIEVDELEDSTEHLMKHHLPYPLSPPPSTDLAQWTQQEVMCLRETDKTTRPSPSHGSSQWAFFDSQWPNQAATTPLRTPDDFSMSRTVALPGSESRRQISKHHRRASYNDSRVPNQWLLTEPNAANLWTPLESWLPLTEAAGRPKECAMGPTASVYPGWPGDSNQSSETNGLMIFYGQDTKCGNNYHSHDANTSNMLAKPPGENGYALRIASNSVPIEGHTENIAVSLGQQTAFEAFPTPSPLLGQTLCDDLEDWSLSAKSMLKPPQSAKRRPRSCGPRAHRRSKTTSSLSFIQQDKVDAQPASVGFVNYTPEDSRKILTGVAPSGSSKTKARREKEAAERRRRLGEVAARLVQEAGGDYSSLEREALLLG